MSTALLGDVDSCEATISYCIRGSLSPELAKNMRIWQSGSVLSLVVCSRQQGVVGDVTAGYCRDIALMFSSHPVWLPKESLYFSFIKFIRLTCSFPNAGTDTRIQDYLVVLCLSRVQSSADQQLRSGRG